MLQALKDNVGPPDHQVLQVNVVTVVTQATMASQAGMEGTVTLDSRYVRCCVLKVGRGNTCSWS